MIWSQWCPWIFSCSHRPVHFPYRSFRVYLLKFERAFFSICEWDDVALAFHYFYNFPLRSRWYISLPSVLPDFWQVTILSRWNLLSILEKHLQHSIWTFYINPSLGQAISFPLIHSLMSGGNLSYPVMILLSTIFFSYLLILFLFSTFIFCLPPRPVSRIYADSSSAEFCIFPLFKASIKGALRDIYALKSWCPRLKFPCLAVKAHNQ